MVWCPYCGQVATDLSADHVFPNFLGGERTIQACRPCNSKFGHTFEGRVADALEPVYVQLAYWGVPVAARERWWRSAYRVDGAILDLSVGRDGLQARPSHPIIEKDRDGTVTAAYFEKEQDLERFELINEQRRPGSKWVRDQKRVQTNLRGLHWRLDLGPALQQMALKMCTAASTLLPNIQPDDRLSVVRSLREIPSGSHDCVAQYMEPLQTIWAKRPALAHTLYVEHVGPRVYGVVEFFGAFPLFVYLAQETKSWGHHAILASLDPVNVREHFAFVEPIGLRNPPAFYTAQEIIAHQFEMVRRFICDARARGASVEPELTLTPHLPDNPILRP